MSRARRRASPRGVSLPNWVGRVDTNLGKHRAQFAHSLREFGFTGADAGDGALQAARVHLEERIGRQGQKRLIEGRHTGSLAGVGVASHLKTVAD